MQAGPEQVSGVSVPATVHQPTPSYDVPRGSCPRCESEQVTHVLAGMPTGAIDLPSWVVEVGCIPPPHDRVCQACELRWQSDEAETPVGSLEELVRLVGATDVEEGGRLLSEDLEQDVVIDVAAAAAGELLFVSGRHGVHLRLPTTLGSVWDAVDDLDEDATARAGELSKNESD